jgi:hypothetical protein
LHIFYRNASVGNAPVFNYVVLKSETLQRRPGKGGVELYTASRPQKSEYHLKAIEMTKANSEALRPKVGVKRSSPVK